MIILGKKAKREFARIMNKLSEIQSDGANIKNDLEYIKNTKAIYRSSFYLTCQRIEISTKIGCSNNCAYCPQEKFISTYCKDASRNRMMRFEDFKLALKHLPPGFVVLFAGMNEPFENPEAFQMLKYALEKGFITEIFTTLKGLTLAQIEELALLDKNKIRLVTIHLPDGEGIMNLHPDDEYLNKLKAISRIEFNYIQYAYYGVLHPDIPDYISTQAINARLISRAGNVDNKEKLPKPNIANYHQNYAHITDAGTKIICELRLSDRYEDRNPTHIDRGVLLPDGSLILCCMDYGLQHTLGNLFKDTYESIMYGETMQEIEKSMLCQNDKEILCRKCEHAVVFDEECWKHFCQTGDYYLMRRPLSPMP